MIKIKRFGQSPGPLQSDAVKITQAKIRKIAKNAKPESNDFDPHWGKEEVRRALWEMQYHKCCYCERVRDWNRESDIEHFRPKAMVTGAAPEHKGYWWLAYEWSNLVFSCRNCNQDYKKNFFPVPNEAARAQTEGDDLTRENAHLIDPCRDEPEQLLAYDWGVDGFVWVLARRDCKKGRTTHEVLGLNRDELRVERAEVVRTLVAIVELMQYGRHLRNLGIIDEAAGYISEETLAKRPFAGFRRDFFRKQGLGQYVSQD